MGRLSGKRALITGSADGIGRASAKLFAREGAQLTLCDIRSDENESLAEEIRSDGGEALSIQTDVGNSSDMQAAFKKSIEAFGGLDIVYNNAGGATSNDGRITEIEIDEFWHAIRLNLFGTVLGCRYGIPYMIASGGGSVINTASIRAFIGTAGADAYTSAKGGIVALTRALALQWAHSNIRVNAISPGVILTARVRKLLSDDDPIRMKTPLGPSKPEDIAPLALYLASDESSQVTGAILPMDGGAAAV